MIAQLLDTLHGDADAHVTLYEALRDDAGARAELSAWLQVEGVTWARDHVPLLAHVIEAAWEGDEVFATVLDDVAPVPQVLNVAVQRSRWVKFCPEHRTTAWRGLRRWMDFHAENPCVSVSLQHQACISAAHVGGVEGRAWSLKAIRTGSTEEARAAAAGIMHVLSSSSTKVPDLFDPVPTVELANLFDAAVTRWVQVRGAPKEGGTYADLGADLVWMLGMLACPSTQDDVARALVLAFSGTRDNDKTAALMATRSYRKRVPDGLERLEVAFTAWNRAGWEEFRSLLPKVP